MEKILIVVDMQKDFVDGALGTPEAEKIVPRVVEKIKNFDRAVEELNRFLPYVDNWATCDMISPKIFAANREKLLPVVEQWLSSAHPYTVRFGIVMLMKHALDGEFSPHHICADRLFPGGGAAAAGPG